MEYCADMRSVIDVFSCFDKTISSHLTITHLTPINYREIQVSLRYSKLFRFWCGSAEEYKRFNLAEPHLRTTKTYHIVAFDVADDAFDVVDNDRDHCWKFVWISFGR